MKRIVLAAMAVIFVCLVSCKSRYLEEIIDDTGNLNLDEGWRTANEPALSEDEEMPGEFTVELSGYKFGFNPRWTYNISLSYSGEDWFGLEVQDLVFKVDGETLMLPIEPPNTNLYGRQLPPTPGTNVRTAVYYKSVGESIRFSISLYQLDSLRSAEEVSLEVQGHQLRFNKKVFAMFDAFCDECVDFEIWQLEQDKKEKEKLEEREKLIGEQP